MKKRYEVIFSGTVQGVGFRFTARNIAAKYKINGWVMNIPDGKVKLLAEGEEKDLNNFISELKNEFKRYIDDCMLYEKKTVNDCEDFRIKFFSSFSY